MTLARTLYFLIKFEVQSSDYLEEDDIERFRDDHGCP
jgi:hypothetical protein